MAEATETDIFQQQKKTIDTLIDVLEKQGQAEPGVVFAPPAEPAKEKLPNYLMYIGIAIAAIFLFKKM